MGKKAKSQTRQILIRKGNENDGNSSIMSTLQPNQQPIHRKIERECMKEQLYEYSTQTSPLHQDEWKDFQRNECACFSLKIIKVPTSEKLAFNKIYQQHSQKESNSILVRLSIGEEMLSIYCNFLTCPISKVIKHLSDQR